MLNKYVQLKLLFWTGMKFGSYRHFRLYFSFLLEPGKGGESGGRDTKRQWDSGYDSYEERVYSMFQNSFLWSPQSGLNRLCDVTIVSFVSHSRRLGSALLRFIDIFKPASNTKIGSIELSSSVNENQNGVRQIRLNISHKSTKKIQICRNGLLKCCFHESAKPIDQSGIITNCCQINFRKTHQMFTLVLK